MAEKEKSKARFIYKIVDIGTSGGKMIDEQLNALGAEGWDLNWAEWRHDDYLRAILSRPVEAEPEPQPAPATTESKGG